MQHSGVARTRWTTARLLSLRRQEQVCLRRHTQRHGMMSTLQRCMKHAHGSTHAVCLLLFSQKNEGHGPAPPADSPRQRSRGIYSLLPLLWDCISQDSCISSHLPLMFPKFNYHLTLFVAGTLPLLRACVVWLWLCYPHFLIHVISPNWTGCKQS